MYLRINVKSRLFICAALIASLSWFPGTAPARAKLQESRKEARKIKNPVPVSVETVEAGKKLYQRHCASCHGPHAKGDGGMALSGGTPSDLTDDVWDYGSTDGEIFIAIRDGVSSDMLGYKEKLEEKQIWQIINYLRDLGPESKTR